MSDRANPWEALITNFYGPEKSVIPADKDAKPRIVVEIGGGIRPLVGCGYRKVYSNEIYYNFDHSVVENPDIVEEKQRLDVYHHVSKDGTELPFENESVDEVVYTNVFGDPNTTQRMRTLETVESLICEALRVIKNDGVAKIVVTETCTPEVFSPKSLSRIFLSKNSNLVIESTDDEDLIAEYSGDDKRYQVPGVWQLIVRKKKD